ncbi:MAG: Photosynthesis system assembly factor [Chloroflexota bacterium]|jgi:hypothetical protein|nr:Photosynthesis system assembly factor [Chloroflexota bacterium]
MLGIAVCGSLPGTGTGLIGPAGALLLILGIFGAVAAWRGLRARRASTAIVAVLLLVLAGQTNLPVSAADCAAAPATSPVPAAPTFGTTVFKKGGGEPNIAISPSGRYMIADGLGGTPAGQPANIFRSTDFGKTFQAITPAFANTGGGDFDIHFLDEHTVVAADLATLNLPANGVYVDRSTDDGSTWTQVNVNQEIYDRPWLDHFGPNNVYLATKGFDGIGYLYTSTDGGQSFGTVPTVIYGNPLFGGPDPTAIPLSSNNAYVDHITVDPRSGDVYVLYGIEAPTTFGMGQPAGAANQLYVAHLVAGVMHSAPVYLGAGDDSFLAGFNWMTVDQAGTLYVLTNGRIHGHWSTRLAYSKDKGATWSPQVDLGAPGASNVYGSIAGAAAGNLSLIYLRGSNENPSSAQNWYAEMATVASADTSSPVVARSRPFDKAMHTQDICFDGILCGLPGFGSDRNLLDYIYNAVGPDGTAWGVFCSDGPLTGSTSNTTPDVVIVSQPGQHLGSGVQS